MKEKIAATIVVYCPDYQRLSENINAISSQVDKVILVVNAESLDRDKLTINDPHRVLMLSNGGNKGIAYALNRGMHAGEKLGYDWVVTLDQDSVCTPDLVSKLVRHIGEERVGIVTPVIDDRNCDDREMGDKPTDEVKLCITSGALTSTKVWKEVGGFTNELFIDYVDYDYCAKLFRHGYRVIRDNEAHLLHEVGHITIKTYGNKHRYMLYNHSPMRDYYIVRNRIYYYHAYPDFVDVAKEKRMLRERIILILLFEKRKIRKGIAILKGAIDSRKLRKKLG